MTSAAALTGNAPIPMRTETVKFVPSPLKQGVPHGRLVRIRKERRVSGGDLKVSNPTRRALLRGYIEAAHGLLTAWSKGGADEQAMARRNHW